MTSQTFPFHSLHQEGKQTEDIIWEQCWNKSQTLKDTFRLKRRQDLYKKNNPLTSFFCQLQLSSAIISILLSKALQIFSRSKVTTYLSISCFASLVNKSLPVKLHHWCCWQALILRCHFKCVLLSYEPHMNCWHRCLFFFFPPLSLPLWLILPFLNLEYL